MKHRLFVSTLTMAALFAVAAIPALAQSTYKAPRTPDGVPDLTGNYQSTSSVPYQRPPNLGAKEFYTPEEMAQRAAAAAARAGAPRDPGVHYDTSQFGLTAAASGTVPFNRTSIISGPTGRIPDPFPAVAAKLKTEQADRREHLYDGPEYRGNAERCIYWGHEGVPMRPVGYNSTLEIEQGEGYVALMHEMIHTAHVIPTDGRPHLDSKITGYFGDSVGHWEGDTLVVDTTNFSDNPALGNGADHNLHVVERFTRTGPDTIMYHFTVTDPSVWEQSWSGEFPLGRIDGQVYEYACQEGNRGMYNILAAQRQAEQEEAAKAGGSK